MDRGREEGEYTDYAIKRENEYIAAREEGETMDNKEGGFAQRTASEKSANTLNEYFFVLIDSDLNFTFNGRTFSLLEER